MSCVRHFSLRFEDNVTRNIGNYTLSSVCVIDRNSSKFISRARQYIETNDTLYRECSPFFFSPLHSKQCSIAGNKLVNYGGHETTPSRARDHASASNGPVVGYSKNLGRVTYAYSGLWNDERTSRRTLHACSLIFKFEILVKEASYSSTARFYLFMH